MGGFSLLVPGETDGARLTGGPLIYTRGRGGGVGVDYVKLSEGIGGGRYLGEGGIICRDEVRVCVRRCLELR